MRRAIAVLGLFLGGCNGCGTTTDAPPAPSASSAGTGAPATATGIANPGPTSSAKGGPRSGGPATMFLKAARSLDLKPEQKEKLLAAESIPRATPPEVRDEIKALQADLVAGVRAGKIDTAKTDKHIAVLDAATNARQAEDAQAINAVWRALEPAQRAEVVKKLRAERPPPDESTDKWLKGGAAGIQAAQNALAKLTGDLDLDADQKKKIDDAIKANGGKGGSVEMRVAARQHIDTILADFDKEGFDAQKAAPDPKAMRGPIGEQTILLVDLAPILKPEQREKLAARLEKRAREGGSD